MKKGSNLIRELLERFPTLSEFLTVTEQQLLIIKGIGPTKVRQILSIIELAKVLNTPTQKKHHIRCPKDVFDYLVSDFRFTSKEHFICLFLNTKNRLIYKEVISIGSLNAAIVHPREVFHAAIRRCSASLICAHNHPSGDPEPSIEDVNLTKRLIAAGEIIGIEVLDHIIIGGNRFYSLKEHGHF